MNLQLSDHFVAFIDLLGFSEMVRSDCESYENQKYLGRLYSAHQKAAANFTQDLDGGLIQFSDSIIFSRPFALSELGSFIASIAEWQKLLLHDGLLCRGGITFGKHFVKDRFVFSHAMIRAYEMEKSQAIYPRIVISKDLLDLASQSPGREKLQLMKEEDDVVFVDYLSANSAEETESLSIAIGLVIENSPPGVAGVHEKMRWLARYSDHKLRTKFSRPRFTSI
jgi:hypothetical protein